MSACALPRPVTSSPESVVHRRMSALPNMPVAPKIRTRILSIMRFLCLTAGLGKVVAIKVHHLVPRRHEVFYKRLLRVVTCIDFRYCSELGVRTEDKVDTGASPLDLVGLPIAPLVDAIGAIGLPLRVHVEQVDEKVVGQHLWPLGEDAVSGLPCICTEDAHATDENRHLRRSQSQQLRPIHQQFLSRQGLPASEVVAEPVSDRLHYREGVHIG